MSAPPTCPGCGDRLSLRLSAQGGCVRCLLRTAFAPPPVPEGRPADFGDYLLGEELGRGGMGVVYRAQQRSLDRPVALKLLPFGLLESEDFLERFEREARLMARLAHPGVARVYEAGISRLGQAYLALELVPGVPLDEFLAATPRPLSVRLALFLQVCEAIQHAHQRGIIHRDLKPSNVLVAETDGAVTSKVIDFGLARPTGEAEPDANIWRSQPAMVGTPLYLSPEQALGGEVDTRTDVYALGALLYEILAARPPFTEADFVDGSSADVQRVLRDCQPLPPSTCPGAPPGVAGDLDAICLRALAKDPAARYPSAGALGDDLRRHLAHEPVQARAPTWRYVAGRFLRRHRAPLAVVSLMFLGLLAAAVFSRTQAVEAQRERDRSQKVKAFLFAVLGSPSPGADGRDVRVVDVLAEAARRAEREFRDDPRTLSEVQLALGTTHYDLSRYAEAEPLLRAALAAAERASAGPSVAQANACKALADLCNFTSRQEEAGTLAARAIGIYERQLPGSVELLRAVHSLASIRLHQGNHRGAQPLLERAVALGRELGPSAVVDLLVAQGDLAVCYQALDRTAEARPLMEEVLRGMKGLPQLRENVSVLLGAQSEILLDLGELEQAEAALRESVARRKELFGPRSQSAGIGLGRLSWVQYRRESLAAAEATARESLEMLRALSPPGARELYYPLRALGFTLLKQGRAAEAEAVLAECLEVSERHLRANQRLVSSIRDELAKAQRSRASAGPP